MIRRTERERAIRDRLITADINDAIESSASMIEGARVVWVGRIILGWVWQDLDGWCSRDIGIGALDVNDMDRVMRSRTWAVAVLRLAGVRRVMRNRRKRHDG